MANISIDPRSLRARVAQPVLKADAARTLGTASHGTGGWITAEVNRRKRRFIILKAQTIDHANGTIC
jgi:hypothetical protein